ncbi:14847_t:CDS:2 [Entrophospora sp. SA101]|nr:14847_t:CDS:2 [Entrophospora sp. SA101]
MGEVTGHGHYKATCNFCKRVWNRGKPKRMAAHLSNNCLQVPHDIRNTILNAFLKEYGSSPLDESSNDDDYDNDRNQDKSENDLGSWINAAYNTLEEDDDENNDSILELLPENNDDSEPSDDIELELERILSLNEVFVVINNNDYVTANQEENTNSEATEEIEDYDPAQLASNYLSDLE